MKTITIFAISMLGTWFILSLGSSPFNGEVIGFTIIFGLLIVFPMVLVVRFFVTRIRHGGLLYAIGEAAKEVAKAIAARMRLRRFLKF